MKIRRARVKRYKFPISRTNRVLMADPVSVNALTVAGSAFELESWLHNALRVANLVIPLKHVATIDGSRLQSVLSELIIFVLAESTNVRVGRTTQPLVRLRKRPSFDAAEFVCLFSGGVDSLSGTLSAARDLGRMEAVFCAHSDQSKIISLVEVLSQEAFKNLSVEVRKISVPPIGVRGYAQLRGFLYCVAAAAWMQLLGATSLLVTECGPTMYQPRFSPLDSVTMTTHPFVLEQAKSVIEILLRRPITLITPFEDFTKAEVMRACPRPDLFPLTHSCISQRFAEHDGTCYGCVIRRLAAIAAGVRDVVYARDPLTDEAANAGNLMSLMVYCRDLLLAYDDMEEFETDKIRRYKKQDLFQRFALDHFAAIHQLVTGGTRTRRSIRELYEEVVRGIGAGKLEDRLRALRQGEAKIDWRREPPT